MAQHEINHRERVSLLRCSSRREEALTNFGFFNWSLVTSAATEHRLARLHIPVAILVPEETIQRGGGFAEFVFVQRDGDFANGGIELEQNPFVIRREQGAFDLALHIKRSCGAPVAEGARAALGASRRRGVAATHHLAETAGVPELVAEIAAEFRDHRGYGC